MTSKSEYIALREMTAAYSAILYSLNKVGCSRDVVSSRDIRTLVQADTGYPFSELAVAKALRAPKPYSFASQVSGSGETGSYKIDHVAAKVNYLSLASSEGSPVWQLENIDHSNFRSAVAEIRAEAAKKYELNKDYDDPLIAPWSDVNFQLMDGMFRQRIGKGARLRSIGTPKIFHRGAFKPEWIAVYVAVITLIVTLWIGGKL